MAGKQRIAWLDMAKGVGMILVILSHQGVASFGNWLYSFHMPLFFFLSGYVFHNRQPFPVFLRKKARVTFLPYFCLGIPMLLFVAGMDLLSGEFQIRGFLSLLVRFFLQRRMWTLWFLACWFFLNLLFYAAVSLLKTEKKLLLAAVILPAVGLGYYRIGGKALPWNVDVCLMAFPFFFAGWWCCRHQESIANLLSRKRYVLPGLCGLLLISVGFTNISMVTTGEMFEMYGQTYGIPWLTYPAAFAGLLMVVILCRWCPVKPICYIGENSMLYFAWHKTIMMPISEALLASVGIVETASSTFWEIAVYKLAQLMLILLLCTACNMLLCSTKTGRKMLGRD